MWLDSDDQDMALPCRIRTVLYTSPGVSGRAAPDAASKPEPEVDLVLLPGQASFSKLGGQRMFLLKYEKEEHFFW